MSADAAEWLLDFPCDTSQPDEDHANTVGHRDPGRPPDLRDYDATTSSRLAEGRCFNCAVFLPPQSCNPSTPAATTRPGHTGRPVAELIATRFYGAIRNRAARNRTHSVPA
jgi:hypothetical protein